FLRPFGEPPARDPAPARRCAGSRDDGPRAESPDAKIGGYQTPFGVGDLVLVHQLEDRRYVGQLWMALRFRLQPDSDEIFLDPGGKRLALEKSCDDIETE